MIVSIDTSNPNQAPSSASEHHGLGTSEPFYALRHVYSDQKSTRISITLSVQSGHTCALWYLGPKRMRRTKIHGTTRLRTSCTCQNGAHLQIPHLLTPDQLPLH